MHPNRLRRFLLLVLASNIKSADGRIRRGEPLTSNIAFLILPFSFLLSFPFSAIFRAFSSEKTRLASSPHVDQ
jgi:hypothetical protein